MHLSLKNSLGKSSLAKPLPSGIFNYLRPDGLSLFRRPDTTSLYKRPLVPVNLSTILFNGQSLVFNGINLTYNG
jgi:hypothetical protein